MKDKPWWLHTDPHLHVSNLSSSKATTLSLGAISATSQNPYVFLCFLVLHGLVLALYKFCTDCGKTWVLPKHGF